MTKSALIRLQDEIDAVRREAFAEGFAAAMRSVQEFAARHLPGSTETAAAPPLEAPSAISAALPRNRHPRRGTNARLIEIGLAVDCSARCPAHRNPQRAAPRARGGAGLYLDPPCARPVGSPPRRRASRPQQNLALSRNGRRSRDQPRLSPAERFSDFPPARADGKSSPDAARPAARPAALAPEAELLGHRRALLGVGGGGQRVIARQLPTAQIFGNPQPVPGPEMPPQSLAAEPAFQAYDIVMLHRALYRDCRHTRRRRLNRRSKVTDRLVDRHDQRRKLVRRERMISDIAGDDFCHRSQPAASWCVLVVHKQLSSQRSKNSLSSYGKVERAQTFSSLLWIGWRKQRNHPAQANRNLARCLPLFR